MRLLQRPLANFFDAVEVLEIGRQEDDVRSALQRALDLPQHNRVRSLDPPLTHHAAQGFLECSARAISVRCTRCLR